MNRASHTRPDPRRCVAPVDGDRLCGADATTDRVIESTVCPLCAEHAAEIDRDRSAS